MIESEKANGRKISKNHEAKKTNNPLQNVRTANAECMLQEDGCTTGGVVQLPGIAVI